jgi:hypothetical protein
MKLLLLVLVSIVPSLSAFGQISVKVYPTTATIPKNGIQSVTAEVSGSANNAVTWSTSGGSPTLINSTGTTVGVKNTATATVTITATSVADNTKTASSTVTFAATPTPLTSHPRLWLTSSDISRLQGWAVAGNDKYVNVLQSAANDALTYANAHWSWTFQSGTGSPDGGWQDSGISTIVGDGTESFALLFGYMSMVDPSSQANRDAWGKRSRDMLMYIANIAVNGPSDSLPFRRVDFEYSDRARYYGEAYGLLLDWLQCATNCGVSQASYLSSGDKTTLRTLYMMWCKALVSAGTTVYTFPLPVGSANSNTTALLTNTPTELYWVGNNYWSMQFRNSTLMGLAIDAADDPLVNGANPVNFIDTSGNGNTLRAFGTYGVGSFLYQLYAVYENPNIVASAYSTPVGNVPGWEAGGSIPASFEYGPQAVTYVRQALLALHTSGNDDPTSAPQLSLMSSSNWDLLVQAFLAQTSPQTFNSPGTTQGPSYYLGAYGDLAKMWAHPIPWSAYFNAKGIYDYSVGNAGALNNDRYPPYNMMDGQSSFQDYWSKGAWSGGAGYDAQTPIGAFMLFDPNASAPTDPRVSGFPTDFYATGEARYAGKTDWTTTASWFTYRCSFEQMDHQQQDCGMFEFYRKGEWITKARTGLPNDQTQYGILATDERQGLTIFNAQDNGNGGTTILSARGSQYFTGITAGDPITIANFGPNYFYAYSIDTNLYNSTHYGTFTDISSASRSILWLKPATIIIYDRANSVSTGKFKIWNISTQVSPTIAGRSASFATTGGQHVYIDGLLPTGGTASLTTKSLDALQQIASLEPLLSPNGFWLQDTDTSNPQTARYLHIMQTVDTAGTQGASTLVQSSAGTAFDGATIGTTSVMFIKNPSDLGTFSSTTFTVPNATTQFYVAGLTPSVNYQATITPSGGNSNVVVANGGSTSTDSAGVLSFTSSGTPPVPPAPATALFAAVPLPAGVVPVISSIAPTQSYVTSKGCSQDGLNWDATCPVRVLCSGCSSATVVTFDGTLISAASKAGELDLNIPLSLLPVPSVVTQHKISLSNPIGTIH